MIIAAITVLLLVGITSTYIIYGAQSESSSADNMQQAESDKHEAIKNKIASDLILEFMQEDNTVKLKYNFMQAMAVAQQSGRISDLEQVLYCLDQYTMYYARNNGDNVGVKKLVLLPRDFRESFTQHLEKIGAYYDAMKAIVDVARYGRRSNESGDVILKNMNTANMDVRVTWMLVNFIAGKYGITTGALFPEYHQWALARVNIK